MSASTALAAVALGLGSLGAAACGTTAAPTTAPTTTALTAPDPGGVPVAIDGVPTTTTPSAAVPTTIVPPQLDLPEHTAELDLVSCELTVTVPNESLRFAVDSAVIPPGPSADLLAEIARQLSTAEVVEIVGHSSPEGPYDHNLRLSAARADAVAAVLRPMLPGVDLVARGVGPDQPLVPDDGTEASRAPNRRVDITGEVTSEVCRSARTNDTIPSG